MARAQWTPGKPAISTDAQGTFHATVPLLDAGTKVADVVVTITADRDVRFDFRAVAGLPADQRIRSFEAWSNV